MVVSFEQKARMCVSWRCCRWLRHSQAECGEQWLRLSRSTDDGWLLGVRCVVGQACERVRLPDLALSTSRNARD